MTLRSTYFAFAATGSALIALALGFLGNRLQDHPICTKPVCKPSEIPARCQTADLRDNMLLVKTSTCCDTTGPCGTCDQSEGRYVCVSKSANPEQEWIEATPAKHLHSQHEATFGEQNYVAGIFSHGASLLWFAASAGCYIFSHIFSMRAQTETIRTSA